MHSSTSNSEHPTAWPETYWQRPIPTAHWQGVSLLTVLLVLVLLVAWETLWRNQGYEPSYADVAESWARQRDLAAEAGPDGVVYTGASRIQFNFDQDAWLQDFGGERPLNLCRVGTNPRPFLSDIAADPRINGLVLVGVTEAVFFAPDFAPPTGQAHEYINHWKKRPVSTRTDYLLSIPFRSALASLNVEDLSLDALLRRHLLRLPNREKAYILPEFPPYLARMDAHRRMHMWERIERDSERAERVGRIWLPLFQLGPPYGGPGLDALFASVKADVEAIRSRGGKVVFLRYPSSGELREVEKARWPREAYWDRLLAETGAPGIHFEDHPELAHYTCPEWSHLSRMDAVSYSRSLIPILKARLAGQ